MVESLNKGHIGDKINSSALSIVREVVPFRGSQSVKNFWDLKQIGTL